MLKHTKQIEIAAHYTDVNKRLFIKTLCDLFNDMANEQTLRLGVDIDTFHAQGITWMLHKIHILIHRMPEKGERVQLETWPSGTDRLFAIRDFQVLSEAGEQLVKLTSEWMVIDLERRRPVRLPESVVNLTRHCEDVVRDLGFELDAKSLPLQYAGSRRFVASYDNIDFNLHVTQASYVGWICNSLPYDFLKSHRLMELEVIYEHEILPENEVESRYEMQQEAEKTTLFHRIVDQAGSKTHCVAKSYWMPLREV